MKNKKKIAAALTAIVLALVMAAGIVPAAAEEDIGIAEETTELEEFIAGWGESYKGTMGEKDYTLDFNEFELGTDFSEIDELAEHWIVGNATADHITKINGKDGENYLTFAPFAQMYLTEGLTDKYVYSVDLKLPDNQGFGMFFRTSGEANINPYFEDDKSGHDIMGIGPNGICLIPSGTALKIYVKYYDERKSADKGMKYINSKAVTVKSDLNFNTRFVTVSVADYGNGAKIFIDGALAASLEFSEIVSEYDEYLSEYSYYSKVVVYDKNGKQKAEVNNALVCADTSVLALGMRISEAHADNIVISEYPEAITSVEMDGTPKTSYVVGDKFDAAGAAVNVTYESGKTKKIAITEDMVEGFDTSAAGDITIKIKYADKEFEFAATVSVPADPTEAPETTAPADATDGAKATESNESKETDDEKKTNKPLKIGLIIGGILIVAIVIAVLLLKKKTGSQKD